MRAPATLCLVALLAFAGCVSPNDLDAATVEPDAPELPRGVHSAGVPVPLPAGIEPLVGALFELGVPAFEPTLGVTSDGAIYYAAADGANGVAVGYEPLVMKSADGGLTWEDVSPRLPTGHALPPETNDPYLYVDPATDRIFQFAMAPILVCSVLSWSDDGGASWTTNPHGCFTTPPWDHQTMVAAAPTTLPTVGYASVLHQCVNSVYAAVCSRSLDGGLTWSPGTFPFLGADDAGVCGGLHGHLVAAPDGTVYLPKAHCGAPMLAISRDDGTTWETVRASETDAAGEGDPAVAVDAAGNVYYIFTDEMGRILLSVSTDGGATWTESVVASPPGLTAALPAIAAGGDGKIVIAYPGTVDHEGYDVAEDVLSAAKWNGYLTISVDATSAEPTFLTTSVNTWEHPLVRGECGSVRCPGFVDFMDVVIGPDGRPYAAFVDACSAECEAADEAENDASMAIVGTLTGGPSLL